MSTRGQIEFSHEWLDDQKKKQVERRTVYRHWDCYDSAVIPDLKEFVKWNISRMSDVEYTTANFIFWSKLRTALNVGKEPMPEIKNILTPETTENRSFLTGFGVCNNDELHGDIEYFYKVIDDEKTVTVEVYETEQKNDKTKLKLLKTIVLVDKKNEKLESE